MCATCGCDADTPAPCTNGHSKQHPSRARETSGLHEHEHEHEHVDVDVDVDEHVSRARQTSAVHDHDHERTPVPASDLRLLHLECDLLAKNDSLADANHTWLSDRRILALNILGGPGAGKTTLLERTVRALYPAPVSVLEGDQATTNDADRVRAAGASAVQINTGSGCHLDAAMVSVGLEVLDPLPGSLLFIENVGNLVCPSLFNLGEEAKVLLLSVTEGEDKPLKYPHAFRSASVLVITKLDLLPHLRFDLDRCLDLARRVNPGLRIFCLSAQRGDGLGDWYDWLRSGLGTHSERHLPQAW
jgi:hydrogenase nickel incorporation protein HypB